MHIISDVTRKLSSHFSARMSKNKASEIACYVGNNVHLNLSIVFLKKSGPAKAGPAGPAAMPLTLSACITNVFFICFQPPST